MKLKLLTPNLLYLISTFLYIVGMSFLIILFRYKLVRVFIISIIFTLDLLVDWAVRAFSLRNFRAVRELFILLADRVSST